MRLTADSQEWLAADAIGDPSLLRDGLTHRDRIALDTHRDARAAMALIREAVEDSVPPGSVARDYSIPEFTVQAEALVRGIYAIADAAGPNVEGHSGQDPPRGKTRAVAAPETLRAAASGPISATVKGILPGR
jgi:hypothetical protein